MIIFLSEEGTLVSRAILTKPFRASHGTKASRRSRPEECLCWHAHGNGGCHSFLSSNFSCGSLFQAAFPGPLLSFLYPLLGTLLPSIAISSFSILVSLTHHFLSEVAHLLSFLPLLSSFSTWTVVFKARLSYSLTLVR